MTDFVPALSNQIKWSVGENKFDQDGKFPKSLSIFIPEEVIPEFAAYLNDLAQQADKRKKGKIWSYAKQAEVEVDGFYINAKGKAGEYGDFGAINPQAFGDTAAQRVSNQSTQPQW